MWTSPVFVRTPRSYTYSSASKRIQRPAAKNSRHEFESRWLFVLFCALCIPRKMFSRISGGTHTPSWRPGGQIKATENLNITGVRAEIWTLDLLNTNTQTNCVAFSPRANYTDGTTAVFRRSDCQLSRIEGVTWSEQRIPTAAFSVF
jgi:hypothetical protein